MFCFVLVEYDTAIESTAVETTPSCIEDKPHRKDTKDDNIPEKHVQPQNGKTFNLFQFIFWKNFHVIVHFLNLTTSIPAARKQLLFLEPTDPKPPGTIVKECESNHVITGKISFHSFHNRITLLMWFVFQKFNNTPVFCRFFVVQSRKTDESLTFLSTEDCVNRQLLDGPSNNKALLVKRKGYIQVLILIMSLM